ncbi:MAG: hypothetical protein K1000chlam3_00358 [Chlamydiae bacterium]|nr:hypothetical protein [Chlamydiota bacterium]
MSITVTTFDDQAKWTENFSDNELEKMKEMFNSSANSKNFIAAALVPVRTNENFARDFFLPTLLNSTAKVKNAIGQIFIILGALFLDIVTFPIRLITVIPRFHTIANQPENPLHKYLREKGTDKRILNAEQVKVKMEWKEKGARWRGSTQWTDKNGKKHTKIHPVNRKEEQSFNFIEVLNINDFISGSENTFSTA